MGLAVRAGAGLGDEKHRARNLIPRGPAAAPAEGGVPHDHVQEGVPHGHVQGVAQNKLHEDTESPKKPVYGLSQSMQCISDVPGEVGGVKEAFAAWP